MRGVSNPDAQYLGGDRSILLNYGDAFRLFYQNLYLTTQMVFNLSNSLFVLGLYVKEL